MSEINQEKFSNIEYYDNGIKLVAITGKIAPDTYKTSNIYIKYSDLKEILKRCGIEESKTVIENTTPVLSSDPVPEDIDEIQDAVY